MSADHSLRSHSPHKTVFGKIGDTYQAYCHTYKTHSMATPLEAQNNLQIEILRLMKSQILK